MRSHHHPGITTTSLTPTCYRDGSGEKTNVSDSIDNWNGENIPANARDCLNIEVEGLRWRGHGCWHLAELSELKSMTMMPRDDGALVKMIWRWKWWLCDVANWQSKDPSDTPPDSSLE